MRHANRAFTLIEMIAVVSIISVLVLLLYGGIYNARKEARDSARYTTAEQLQLAIKLYKEAHDEAPDYDGGVEIGVGETIDAELEPFLPGFKPDPLSGNDEYGYLYISNFNCGGREQDIIVIKKFETEDQTYYSEVCGGSITPPSP